MPANKKLSARVFELPPTPMHGESCQRGGYLGHLGELDRVFHLHKGFEPPQELFDTELDIRLEKL